MMSEGYSDVDRDKATKLLRGGGGDGDGCCEWI